jgi:hypothetical protein
VRCPVWFIPKLVMAPVNGVVWLGELIRDQVDQEFENQSHSARRQLEEIESARLSGEISEAEALRREPEIIARITGLPTAGEAARSTSKATVGD